VQTIQSLTTKAQAEPNPPDADRMIGTTADIRSIDIAARSVDVIASTDTLDSHGTIIDQTSWQLGRYEVNPVVLYGHDRYSLPVGHASNVRVQDGRLQARLTFVTEKANPFAEQVWQSIVQKSLRAVSVGFLFGDVDLLLRDGMEVPFLRNCTLLEISMVPLPSNPDTVAKQRARMFEHAAAKAAQRDTLTVAKDEDESDPIVVLKKPADAASQPVQAETRELAPDTQPEATPATPEAPKAQEEPAVEIREATPAETLEVRYVVSTAAAGEKEDIGFNARIAALQTELERAVTELAAFKSKEKAATRAALMAENRHKLTPRFEKWCEKQPVELLAEMFPELPALEVLAKEGTKSPSIKITDYGNPDLNSAMSKVNKGLGWAELSPMEKHRLVNDMPELANQLRDARRV
jgi:HK97 family phage prohead protease